MHIFSVCDWLHRSTRPLEARQVQHRRRPQLAPLSRRSSKRRRSPSQQPGQRRRRGQGGPSPLQQSAARLRPLARKKRARPAKARRLLQQRRQARRRKGQRQRRGQARRPARRLRLVPSQARLPSQEQRKARRSCSLGRPSEQTGGPLPVSWPQRSGLQQWLRAALHLPLWRASWSKH